VNDGDCVVAVCGGAFGSGLCEYVREAFARFFVDFVWIFWFQGLFLVLDVDLFKVVLTI
jgi:hypothetical protein